MILANSLPHGGPWVLRFCIILEPILHQEGDHHLIFNPLDQLLELHAPLSVSSASNLKLAYEKLHLILTSLLTPAHRMKSFITPLPTPPYHCLRHLFTPIDDIRSYLLTTPQMAQESSCHTTANPTSPSSSPTCSTAFPPFSPTKSTRTHLPSRDSAPSSSLSSTERETTTSSSIP